MLLTLIDHQLHSDSDGRDLFGIPGISELFKKKTETNKQMEVSVLFTESQESAAMSVSTHNVAVTSTANCITHTLIKLIRCCKYCANIACHFISKPLKQVLLFIQHESRLKNELNTEDEV